MRILYGVQGTGNGHITRARTMLPALRAAGIDVDFVFSGRPSERYFDMESFGRYRAFAGLTYHMHKGRVRWPQTLRNVQAGRLVRDVRELNLKGYDCVLTDFEPVSAWAAKLQGVPAVGLAHQYALRYPIPGVKPWLKYGVSAFAPADKYLGVHWQPFGHPVLPPLIQTAADAAVGDDGFILVYLPFENFTFVCRWLKTITGCRFRIYTDTPRAFSDGHIDVRPLSREMFPQDLARCSGVVCNAGFGLCSEVMALGKKMLVRPLQNHVEQQSNALILQQSGRATIMRQFDAAILQGWLAAPAPGKICFPAVAPAVAAWLANGCVADTQDLADSVWQSRIEVPADGARVAG
ncbi:MAG: glycosyltransferase family protein [Neisseria sp.]|nr:glycosyltransferase family protein [Neisseria sp.]